MAGIAEIIDELVPDPVGGPVGIVTQRMRVDMPLEVRPRRDADGRLVLEASPPTQSFRTSVMPVFHRIEMNVELVAEPEGAA